MITKKYLLKLFLLALASAAIGAGVVLALNYQTVKEYLARRSAPVVEQLEPNESQKQEPKIATFSGTIKPLGPSIYMQGTHTLEDSAGETVTILESPKIDLGFLEGQTVEVEGVLKETVEGEGTILTVDKVRF